MPALDQAQERNRKALDRLEAALRALSSGDGRQPDLRAAAERAALARDCELLREECDTLRRELAGLRAREARLAAAVDQAEHRLDGAITELGELAGE